MKFKHNAYVEVDVLINVFVSSTHIFIKSLQQYFFYKASSHILATKKYELYMLRPDTSKNNIYCNIDYSDVSIYLSITNKQEHRSVRFFINSEDSDFMNVILYDTLKKDKPSIAVYYHIKTIYIEASSTLDLLYNYLELGIVKQDDFAMENALC